MRSAATPKIENRNNIPIHSLIHKKFGKNARNIVRNMAIHNLSKNYKKIRKLHPGVMLISQNFYKNILGTL